MRSSWILVFAFLSAAAGGQVTANALHNRYPAPSREQIDVRPGISMTVVYGPKLVACEIRIHPTRPSLLTEDDPNRTMAPNAVTEVIDELAPPDGRGKAGQSAVQASGCNIHFDRDFEHVKISRTTHACNAPEAPGELEATLLFKWPDCLALRIPRLQPHP